jgi:hypothetical protein
LFNSLLHLVLSHTSNGLINWFSFEEAANYY